MISLIKYVDFFGETPSLFINSNKKTKSTIGGILTILVSIFFVFCMFLFEKGIWRKESPITNLSVMPNSDPKHIVIFEDFELVLTLRDNGSGSFETFIDEKIYSIDARVLTLKKWSLFKITNKIRKMLRIEFLLKT